MCWKNLKKLPWKEIFKVSSIVGFIGSIVSFWNTGALSPLLGVIATGLILSKKLDNKSSWGILFGMIITGFVLYLLGALYWLFGLS